MRLAGIALVGLTLLFAGCSVLPTSGEPPAGEPPPPTVLSADYPRKPAVDELLLRAELAVKNDRPDMAVALLERAVSIDSRDPLVWRELAKVRLQQGQVNLAEQMALKSNRLAGDDLGLQVANWQMISELRAMMGNPKGARLAADQARKLQQQ
jgi:predicted Zn-dependent protease